MRRTKVFSTAFSDSVETPTQDDKIVSKLKQEFSIDTERTSSFIKIMNGDVGFTAPDFPLGSHLLLKTSPISMTPGAFGTSQMAPRRVCKGKCIWMLSVLCVSSYRWWD
ncbi:hypothetical protein YC2023_053559 [Brassica napus]